MIDISTPPLPDDALLGRYAAGTGNHTDCYMVTVAGTVSLGEYVTAFYTAPLFRCERVILKLAVRRPSTDQDAADVAHGRTLKFAAWTVEDRSDTQLLMCDMASKTRSWFMIRATSSSTQLYFGSAVIADPKTGHQGALFHALAPLHNLYARALLKGAVRRLSQDPSPVAAR